MEGWLITDNQVWFGIQEPEWPEEEDFDYEEKLKVRKKINLRIKRSEK